jgi:hypothetical protein
MNLKGNWSLPSPFSIRKTNPNIFLAIHAASLGKEPTSLFFNRSSQETAFVGISG